MAGLHEFHLESSKFIPCSHFFSISGYLYQKFSAGNFTEWNHGKIVLGYKNFILKKVISLGIPYLFFR